MSRDLWNLAREVTARAVFAFILLGRAAVGGEAADAVFTVNDAGDGSDAAVGDRRCLTDGGACTLRAAIEEANASSSAVRIAFAIPGEGPHTIVLGRALPAVEVRGGRVTIDASTQPGFLAGELLAGIAPVWAVRVDAGGLRDAGLRIRTPATVRGLEVAHVSGSDTAGYAIHVGADDSVVEGCFAHGSWGGIVAHGVNVRIGGAAPGQGNLSSGNRLSGITVFGGATLHGNVVGLDPTGVWAVPDEIENRQEIGVYVEGGADNVIGGSAPGEHNLIAGNSYAAVFIKQGVHGTRVRNNAIGLNRAGDDIAPCTVVEDRGGGTTFGDGSSDNNRYCTRPPLPPGCCQIAGEKLPVTCVDSAALPEPASEALCVRLTADFGASLIHFNPDASCDAGTCPAPATATPTATAFAPPTATPSPTSAADPPTSTPAATNSPPPSRPPGDCAGDGIVTIADLILGVNIALGHQAIAACPAFDTDGTGQVTINELILAVSAALGR